MQIITPTSYLHSIVSIEFQCNRCNWLYILRLCRVNLELNIIQQKRHVYIYIHIIVCLYTIYNLLLCLVAICNTRWRLVIMLYKSRYNFFKNFDFFTLLYYSHTRKP